MLHVFRSRLIHFGSVYMTRWVLEIPKLGAIRLHHTTEPDGCREPHDHPWWFVSLVLWGSYTHDLRRAPTAPTERILRRWGSVALVRSHYVHRIIGISRGGVWTLVITGPKRRRWGFWLPDGSWVDRRTYFDSLPDGAEYGNDQWNLIGGHDGG